MSKSDVFENDLLKLIFNNVAITSIGDAGGLPGSTVADNLWMALHTAYPGEADTATTSETAYTGYARQAFARTAAAWAVTGNSVSPVAAVDFPEATGLPGGALTHASVVNTASGVGKILYSGALNPTITMQIGTIPRIKNTSTIMED